ncbi:hypothetical protein [Moraxella lacunata]|uniref:hypothetical protein n=1 Tax=Moraxella lacunata TaxID=477 RepID=UPI003EE141DF
MNAFTVSLKSGAIIADYFCPSSKIFKNFKKVYNLMNFNKFLKLSIFKIIKLQWHAKRFFF